MLGLIVRAKAFYEWFGFAGEALSALGVIKRAAAATAIIGGAVGVVAGGAAMVTPSQAKIVERAIATHAPEITPAIREQVMQVKEGNLYSKLFLTEADREPLLRAILAICKDGRALPHEQCDIAADAEQHVAAKAREQAMIEARRKAASESPKVGKLPMPWEL